MSNVRLKLIFVEEIVTGLEIVKLKSVEAAAMLFKVFVAIVVQFAFNVYVQRNAEVGKYIHLNAEASSDSFDQDISFIQSVFIEMFVNVQETVTLFTTI